MWGKSAGRYANPPVGNADFHFLPADAVIAHCRANADPLLPAPILQGVRDQILQALRQGR